MEVLEVFHLSRTGPTAARSNALSRNAVASPFLARSNSSNPLLFELLVAPIVRVFLCPGTLDILKESGNQEDIERHSLEFQSWVRSLDAIIEMVKVFTKLSRKDRSIQPKWLQESKSDGEFKSACRMRAASTVTTP